MSNFFPVAVPGDICILLVPDGPEQEHILEMQKKLQARFGGKIFSPTHVTAQRFSSCSLDVVRAVAAFLQPLRPFQMYADRLTQFYSEFWGKHVLRWHVQPTPEWRTFQHSAEERLRALDCPPHYPPEKPATCTALEIDQPVDLSRCVTEFPIPLFSVRNLQLSRVEENSRFTILEEIFL